MRSPFARPVLLLSIVLLLAAYPRPLHAAGARPIGILFLHFGSKDAPSAVQIRNSFTRVLQENLKAPFGVYVDSIDDLGSDPPVRRQEHMGALIMLFRERYSTANIKIVVPIGNDAIAFVAEHGRTVLPDASVVYVATTLAAMPELPKDMPATGVLLPFDVQPTIDLALRLHPGTRKLYIVAGSSPFDRAAIAIARQTTQTHGERVAVEFIGDLSYDETFRRVSNLPQHSIVLFLTFGGDSTGASFIPAQVERVFAAATPAPIYVVYGSGVGYGAVGGIAVDFDIVGTKLGLEALQVLRRVRAQDIRPVEGGFTHPMFDWIELRRWGVRERDIPVGSLVINHEPSLWEQYRWMFIGVMAVIFLQAAVLAGLITAGIRRRRAERQLAERVEHENRLAALASAIARAPDELQDVDVAKALDDLLVEYRLDRIVLVEFEGDRLFLKARHDHGESFEPACPREEFDVAVVRWITDQLSIGLPCLVSDISKLPPEAADARALLERRGVRAFAAFPLDGDGGLAGATIFSSLRNSVEWRGETLEGLRVVMDILSSSRKKRYAQQALNLQEELNGTVLDSLHSHLAVLDREGKILTVNRAWREFWTTEGSDSEGTFAQLGRNYLGALRNLAHEDARVAAAGIADVAAGKRRLFEFEHGCWSDERRRWFQMVVSPLLHAGGVVVRDYDVTERREAEAARTNLSRQLVHAQEKERATIARELHDDVSQRLALIAIGLRVLEKSDKRLSEQTRKELDQLFQLTNEVSRDLQQVSHQLHSAPLQHLGLVAAVRSLCADFSRHSGIQAECIASDGLKTPVQEDIRLALFRIAQEALRNASKHGHAAKVRVELSRQENRLVLTVSDDGVGFDPRTMSDGLGLVSMSERMRLVGGVFRVRSSSGNGTTVEASVVCAEKAPVVAAGSNRSSSHQKVAS